MELYKDRNFKETKRSIIMIVQEFIKMSIDETNKELNTPSNDLARPIVREI